MHLTWPPRKACFKTSVHAHVTHGARNDACSSVYPRKASVCCKPLLVATHRERLPASRLTVRKDGAVDTLEGFVDKATDARGVEKCLLRRRRPADARKPVRSQDLLVALTPHDGEE